MRPRVLIIDDSALIREVLSRLLTEGGCEVVGTASDPLVAMKKLPALRPDVLTLDVEMPGMNGLEFLVKLMRHKPLPVVMVSSLTERNAAATLRAFELGAIEVVAKPKLDVTAGLSALSQELVQKVKAAAGATVRVGSPTPRPTMSRPAPMLETTDRVIFIGASTGGTEALKVVLAKLPADAPGVVIVQHMPEAFTSQFAKRLNDFTALRVAEATHGARVLTGHAFVAPGNRHLRVLRHGASYTLSLSDEAPLMHHRPSVDLCFESGAESVGPNAVAALMTGMGSDGANGLLRLRAAGARTFAQDEASCVVYGMPKEAVQRGAVERSVPLAELGAVLLQAARETRPKRPAA